MPINENDFFREVTLRICGSLDIDQALSSVFEYIKKHMPVDSMGLGYSDLTASRLRVVAKVARDGAKHIWSDRVTEIPLSDILVKDLYAQTEDHPFIVTINRPEDLDRAEWRDVFPKLATDSAMFLRLVVRGEEVGVLLLSAEGLDCYSEHETALIETIREPFAIAMINARRYRELKRMKDLLAEDNRALTADIQRSLGVEVVGADFGLREVMEQVRQIALSTSPTLLLGETGTGKEVIANAIHTASPRSKGPMISMQCGAIPDSLLDSELFGHEKGAFTGASERKRGRFERSDGGTLFLDEIGELSPEAQVKLLRVLQERRFERVGGTKTIEVDVRVVAATHRDLDKMVRLGAFREDLWYRLNVLPIRIPPLRLRPEDIPSLTQYFLNRKAQEMNLQHIPRIDSHTLKRLKAYEWPGNVRELQSVIERALILSRGDTLQIPELGVGRLVFQQNGESIPPEGTVLTMDQAAKRHILSVLERTGGQIKGKTGAAELLQMNPSTLRFRMQKLGIKKPKRRNPYIDIQY